MLSHFILAAVPVGTWAGQTIVQGHGAMAQPRTHASGALSPLLSSVASGCWSQPCSHRAPCMFGERMTFPKSYWLMSPGQPHSLGHCGAHSFVLFSAHKLLLGDFRGSLGSWFHLPFSSPVPSPSSTEARIIFLKY